MERLARGSMSAEPTEVSDAFSRMMLKLMELEGCFADNRDVTKTDHPDIDIIKLK